MASKCKLAVHHSANSPLAAVLTLGMYKPNAFTVEKDGQLVKAPDGRVVMPSKVAEKLLKTLIEKGDCFEE